MKHDTHFLRRLERLDREHAELALGLYYDGKLVAHILSVSLIPEGAKRVALCLGTPENGPFLIVARDGHFVTALGEGMKVGPNLPVVSRHRLDKISESVASLRELVADAQAGRSQLTRRMLSAVYRSGPGLGQEQFDDLARWLPLLEIKFLRAYFDLVLRSNELFHRLARARKITKRDSESLHDFWADSWALGHLTLLMASDGGARLKRLFEVFEVEQPGCTLQLCSNLVHFGVLSTCLRGAWIASKLTALVIPAAKHRYVDAAAPWHIALSDGLSLSAAGSRHRRYRAEVGKVLARAPAQDPHSHVRRYYEKYAKSGGAFEAHTVEVAQEFMRGLFSEEFPAEQVPNAVAAAFFLAAPRKVRGSHEGLECLLEQLPWVVTIEARDFYFPDPLARFVRGPWTFEEGVALFDACTGGGIRRPQPVVTGPKVGRNQPCPCGSGRKYKRCCGG